MDGMLKKRKMVKFIFKKNFTFKNFSESQKFVNEVGNMLRRRSSPRYNIWMGIC